MSWNENLYLSVGACDGEPCFKGVRCTNIGYGNFKCEACPKGYRGDGKTCTDINEVVMLYCLQNLFEISTFMYFLFVLRSLISCFFPVLNFLV